MWWSSTCACGSLSGSNGASEQERGGARVSGACLTRGRLTSIGARAPRAPPPQTRCFLLPSNALSAVIAAGHADDMYTCPSHARARARLSRCERPQVSDGCKVRDCALPSISPPPSLFQPNLDRTFPSAPLSHRPRIRLYRPNRRTSLANAVAELRGTKRIRSLRTAPELVYTSPPRPPCPAAIRARVCLGGAPCSSCLVPPTRYLGPSPAPSLEPVRAESSFVD